MVLQHEEQYSNISLVDKTRHLKTVTGVLLEKATEGKQNIDLDTVDSESNAAQLLALKNAFSSIDISCF